MINKKQSNSIEVSADIAQVIQEGQQLVSYMAKHGQVSLDPELAEVMINAKYKLQKKQWSAQDERDVLHSYDQLAKAVAPVSMESIQAISRLDVDKPSQAERAVAWYRRYTLVALVCLLLVQVYYLFGHSLAHDLKVLYESRNEWQVKVSKASVDSAEYVQIQQSYEEVGQRLDANYNLLKVWNRVWLFGLTFNSDIPPYSQEKLAVEQRRLEREQANANELDNLHLSQTRLKARLQLFENMLFAQSVLEVLQGYILPLLYGLLGAFIFVLRDLLKEIKAITFTSDSEIRYRLRLTLGALGGMIIGWFLNPQELSGLASLSPMALAFLMGYNVDVLFAIMDQIIDKLRDALANGSAAQAQPERRKVE
ncbi:hypothetical protein N474_21080 [Pseudoalteromonas luteoviolacea CPMOR-2]|uniref:Uncharacterized protein n=1 Tax=Pseudoalteromonas luteoviolacea DSM 6061 TaxID=1365250 RepID=A0A166WX16_9GAMM|nr:hypothetical protein [Pseudoalteromonas luteoviolacea]KZN38767.1 hypothetical protein N475_15325 [Pseudoalteromonas luteoviolacea DSM 6061]KZN53556.1 hypothetical protein N474_21080 [Pseudoalteromonas luteoviolacea CPMOR-2]MBE0387682.1 hypothetical protein [Pseudoalteromonas luteoviolacea DSM 6061]